MSTFIQYRVYVLCAATAFAAFCILAPLFAHAADFVPLAQTPGGSKLGQLYSSGDFSNFINGLFKFAIALGAIGAVLRLAYAGYLYMGQSDMWSHKGEAKDIIKDVTLGLLLLLAIYLILYQVNRDILTLKALRNIKPVQKTTPAADSFVAPAQDPTLNGFGVSGNDTFNPQPVSP